MGHAYSDWSVVKTDSTSIKIVYNCVLGAKVFLKMHGGMEQPCKMNHSLVLAFVGSFFTSRYSTAPDGKEIVAIKAYILTTKLLLYRCFLEKKKRLPHSQYQKLPTSCHLLCNEDPQPLSSSFIEALQAHVSFSFCAIVLDCLGKC